MTSSTRPAGTRRQNFWTKPDICFILVLNSDRCEFLSCLFYSFVISDDCGVKNHMKQAVINKRPKLV